MSVEELKRQLVAMSPEERKDVSAFLGHLQRANDPEYRKFLADQLDDKDPTHWLTLEEFERRLGSDE